MSKFKTKYFHYTDRSFKKKFENLINDERKSNNKINLAVTKILKEILEKGDDGLNRCVGKFDKIKVKKVKDLFISKDILKIHQNTRKTASFCFKKTASCSPSSFLFQKASCCL